MSTMLWIILGVIIVLLIAIPSSKKAGTQQKLTGFKPIEEVQLNSSKGKEVFDALKEVFESGEDETVMQFKNKIGTVTDEGDYKYVDALYTELMNRITLIGGRKGLELHQNETSYFSSKNTDVYTIQKLNKNITYGGIRTNLNGFRTGTFNVSSNDVEGYRISFRGKAFVTNQRVVIVGENKNKSIPLSKIISYAPYEKNGILINIENGGSIILDMITNGTFEVGTDGELYFHDTKVAFLYALDKALSSIRK